MKSTLIPERPLLISPTLAATIGLEEAVMLHVLGELIAMQGTLDNALQSAASESSRGIELDTAQLQKALPFWAPIDVRRIQSSLQSLGLLLVEEGAVTGRIRYSIDDGVVDSSQSRDLSRAARGDSQVGLPVYTQKPAQASSKASSQAPSQPASQAMSSNGAATLIPPNWTPEETWLKQCQQHNIPKEFVRDALPEFVQYWRDRAQARFSWGNAFYKHVLKLWREEQSRRAAFEQASDMSEHWRPSAAAQQILTNAQVNAHFIEDAIPEFVMYWQERGTGSAGPWNTRFIEHVRRQWARYTAMQGFDDTPRPINGNWTPSADFYETLQLAEIDAEFANARVAEFVLYWRDSQQARASWNTTFLQFVKAEWARKAKDSSGVISANGEKHAEHRRGLGSGTNSVEELLQQLGDRSWAG